MVFDNECSCTDLKGRWNDVQIWWETICVQLEVIKYLKHLTNFKISLH